MSDGSLLWPVGKPVKVMCPGDGAYQVVRRVAGVRWSFVRYPNGAKVVYRENACLRVKHGAKVLRGNHA